VQFDVQANTFLQVVPSKKSMLATKQVECFLFVTEAVDLQTLWQNEESEAAFAQQ
jgi:hypothetical protein